MSNRPPEQRERMLELQRLHRVLCDMEQLSFKEGVEQIAEMTGRTVWTVRIWMSDRSTGYTIPRDTLSLLKLRIENQAA